MSDKSNSNNPDSRHRDMENGSFRSIEHKQVIHMIDKTVINNRQFVHKKNQKKLTETVQTVSQLGMNAYRSNMMKSRNSDIGTPKGREGQQNTEMNIQEENIERNSNLNFDISQNYDEITEFQELHVTKEGIKKVDARKNIKRDSTPISLASEPMNKRLSISVKNENEEEMPLNHETKEENSLRKKFSRSRTGIIEKPPSPKKFLSNTSSYRQGDTYLRAGEHEEL